MKNLKMNGETSMKNLLAILALTCAACASTPKAAKEWESETIKNKSQKMLATVSRTQGVRPGTIIYFHGLGDSVDSPRKSMYDTTEIVKMINATGYTHVATVGFEPSLFGKSDIAWMLDPMTVASYKAELERIIAAKGLKRPFVGVGMSMGGHNLATFAMTAPDFLDRVVLLNPMLMRGSEWAKFTDVGLKPTAMPGEHFSQSDWVSFANPFIQLERAEKMPSLWVTACKQDDFGLFPGTDEFVTQLRAKNFQATFVPNDGCDHYTPKTAGLVEWIQ